MWLILSELGVPFIRDIWNKTQGFKLTSGVNTDLIMAYLRFLAESGLQVDGFWQSDTMLDELIGTSGDDKKANDKAMDMEEQQRLWGTFMKDDEMDIDAYYFLNNTFEKHTQGLESIDVNLENRYRDLAKAELITRQAYESGDVQEIAKAQDNLRKILDMLKLSDFQSREMSDEKRAFEFNVSLIENYRPAECEELKEFLDKVGYEKEKAILMRSIRNAIAETRNYPDIPKEYR